MLNFAIYAFSRDLQNPDPSFDKNDYLCNDVKAL